MTLAGVVAPLVDRALVTSLSSAVTAAALAALRALCDALPAACVQLVNANGVATLCEQVRALGGGVAVGVK